MMTELSVRYIVDDVPSWLILVFKFPADLGDRFAEVVG
jgi:hypothetical protein